MLAPVCVAPDRPVMSTMHSTLRPPMMLPAPAVSAVLLVLPIPVAFCRARSDTALLRHRASPASPQPSHAAPGPARQRRRAAGSDKDPLASMHVASPGVQTFVCPALAIMRLNNVCC